MSIRGGCDSRRPVGEPGPPRGSLLPTISDDHFLTLDKHDMKALTHQPLQIQREYRSSKRGLRSEAALLQRKCNRQTKRRIHRRQHRWCCSNMRGLAEDMLGGSLGSCSQTTVKTTQGPQPLKDARNRSHTRVYGEHRNRHKADLSLYKMPYGSMIKIVSLNARSLLKPTMHRQIIDYMRTNQVHILAPASR